MRKKKYVDNLVKNKPLLESMRKRMSVENLSSETVESYVRGVIQLEHFSGKSLEILTPEDVLTFLYYLKDDQKRAQTTIRIAASGIKYFYKYIVVKNDMVNIIPNPKRELRLPEILSGKEIKRLFDLTDNIKHLTIMKVAYSAGLRRSEIQTLRVEDIDSKRMEIRIRQGKGKKDRKAILSKHALLELRKYYKACKPEGILFYGRSKHEQISETALAWILGRAVQRAEIKRKISTHTLRHSFASHQLSMGTDIFTIKKLLGHEDIRTTMLYLHINYENTKPIKSPLDVIYP